MSYASNLTALINDALNGDGAAADAAFEMTYADLCRIAHSRIRSPSQSGVMDTKSIVHESYLRFVKQGNIQIKDREHFLRYSSRVIRSVIVDEARKSQSNKRGGEYLHVTLGEDAERRNSLGAAEILDVHEALEKLAKLDETMVQVVEMRYFAGMTETEIATALRISDRTVRRIWKRARVWLAEELA